MVAKYGWEFDSLFLSCKKVELRRLGSAYCLCELPKDDNDFLSVIFVRADSKEELFVLADMHGKKVIDSTS